MHCPKCGQEFMNGERICSHCGFDSSDLNLEYQNSQAESSISNVEISQYDSRKDRVVMKKASYACFAIAVVLIIVGCVFFNKGFDKKNNYLNSTTYTDLNQNAYVGGDAYNYIINSEYFVGYIIIGSAMFICTAIFAGIGAYLYVSSKVQIQKRPIIENKPIENESDLTEE